MKKIFCTLLAAAAVAGCTKMDVAYEAPQEIGFRAVAGNITKAVVDGNTFPTSLSLYVNAFVEQTTLPTTPDYINNGLFVNKNGTTLWCGNTPYYWPNEKTLHFVGYSNAGNIASLIESLTPPSYNPSTDILTISGYTPGTGTAAGANDLMWFPNTKYENEAGYDKTTESVPVDMYHTCSWITFLVQGEGVTGGENSTYVVNEITIHNIDQTANLSCSGANTIRWSENEAQTENYIYSTTGDNTNYNIVSEGISLVNTSPVTTTTDGETNVTVRAKNVETGEVNNTTGGNIVLIPQSNQFTTATQAGPYITVKYSYESSTGAIIEETVTNLPLMLDKTNPTNNKWEPGKHYVYTITVKANEILIAPTPKDWTDVNSGGVTVE